MNSYFRRYRCASDDDIVLFFPEDTTRNTKRTPIPTPTTVIPLLACLYQNIITSAQERKNKKKREKNKM
jgi:hypothetical protein